MHKLYKTYLILDIMTKIKGVVKDIKWVISWEYNCINSDCPICRNNLESSRNVSINSCGHGFHQNCISQWFTQLNSHKKCPVCNKDFIKDTKYLKINKNYLVPQIQPIISPITNITNSL